MYISNKYLDPDSKLTKSLYLRNASWLQVSWLSAFQSAKWWMSHSRTDYFTFEAAANGKKQKSWIEMNKELCKDFLLVKTSFIRMVIQYTIEKATIVPWLNTQKIILEANHFIFLNLNVTSKHKKTLIHFVQLAYHYLMVLQY